MHLSRLAYFADFILYPALGLLLIICGLSVSGPEQVTTRLLVLVLGLAGWTFIEYVAHRYILHAMPYFRKLHGAHHADPRALIGAPTWTSLPLVLFGVLIPFYFLFGSSIALMATAGLVLGYFAYFTLHHLVHTGDLREYRLFQAIERRHLAHHHLKASANFGITTIVWDRLFGTALDAQQRAADRRRAVPGSPELS